MMNKQILFILSLFGVLSFSSCTYDANSIIFDGTGEIYFSVVDTTKVEMATRTSLSYDVDLFNVSLKKGNTPIFTNRKYIDIVGTTMACPVGSDYLFTVESCTELEAESVNDNWGQAHIAGNKSFEVVANDSKMVTVNCGLVNSFVSVDFSDFVESEFTVYSVNIYANDDQDRILVFDKTNKGKTAYFNVGEAGRNLSYNITLSSLDTPYNGTFKIEPSKSYKLYVKVDNDDVATKAILRLMVDGTLMEEKILTENISPYIIKSF